MKIKVCGIRTKQNLDFLSDSAIDFIGFIFYDQSKRDFSEGNLTAEDLKSCEKSKVGVFVNEELNKVIEIVTKYGLDYIQLHGNESITYCEDLKNKGYSLIKAFSVSEVLPDNLQDYEGVVDYFLFDTKGKSHGGNGVQFDWSVLDAYQGSKPFFLSGGIGPNDVEQIKQLEHAALYSLDVNSKFEIEPGLKDELLLGDFINEIKN